MSQPYLSIIIPVYNNRNEIIKTLNQIQQQTYPSDKIETLVIDNGSTDGTVDEIKKFSDVIFIKEEKYLDSPYSARNRGIENSNGDIIVFLDSTCTPVNDWLKEGIQSMEKTNSDIVGGNVLFDINEYSTFGEWCDSLINIKMEESITKKSVAKTANLFIRESLFKSVGVFPEGIRSGGDVDWTKKATEMGFKLTFSKKAIVKKKARNYQELLKKTWRVSKARPFILLENKRKADSIKLLFYKFLKLSIPPNPYTVKKTISTRGEAYMKNYFINIYVMISSVYFVSKVSSIKSLLKIIFTK